MLQFMSKGRWGRIGLVLAVLTLTLTHAQRERPPASAEHEYYLSYRTCFAFMVGLEWIEDALNKVMEQSVANF